MLSRSRTLPFPPSATERFGGVLPVLHYQHGASKAFTYNLLQMLPLHF